MCETSGAELRNEYAGRMDALKVRLSEVFVEIAVRNLILVYTEGKHTKDTGNLGGEVQDGEEFINSYCLPLPLFTTSIRS